MIPVGNPAAGGLAIVLILIAFAGVVTDLLAMILVVRRFVAPAFSFSAGLMPVLLFGTISTWQLAGRTLLPSIVVALFFIPIPIGILTMIVSAIVQARSESRRSIALAFFLICICGLAVMTNIIIQWQAMARREALYEAVLHEDSAAAQALLTAGAARDAADAPFRQGLLVSAAHDANPELVKAIVNDGASPNVADDGRTPLLAALTADPILRLHPIELTVHRRNQLEVVRFLLDHGADPNATGTTDGSTPAEAAWALGNSEGLRLLKEKGARDADRVGERFEELMDAAAVGDESKVKALLAEHGGSRQRDPQGKRSPLVVAAANGHTGVVGLLLRSYGEFVKCDLIGEAITAAAENNHAEIFASLVRVCFNEYDGTAMVAAARAGSVAMIRMALAQGYSPNVTAGKQSALQAAVAANQRDAVAELLKAGAHVDAALSSSDPAIAALLAAKTKAAP